MIRFGPGGLAALLAAAFAAPAARAQVRTSDEAAAIAILRTPIGALPSVMRLDLPADSVSRTQLQLRYGAWKATGQPSAYQNYGATVLFRLRQRLSAGGTLGYRRCSGCDGVLLADVDADGSVFHQTNERYGEGFVDVRWQASAGFGRNDTARVTAVSVGGWLPVAVSLPEPNNALATVSFAPGLAWGHLHDGLGTALGGPGSGSGVRALVNASFSWLFDGPLAVHVSVQRVLIGRSANAYGIAGSWRFGAPREARRR